MRQLVRLVILFSPLLHLHPAFAEREPVPAPEPVIREIESEVDHNHCTTRQFQHKTFCHEGVWFVFYSDGRDFWYQTSGDSGRTWHRARQPVAAAPNGSSSFDVLKAGDTVYISHAVYPLGRYDANAPYARDPARRGEYRHEGRIKKGRIEGRTIRWVADLDPGFTPDYSNLVQDTAGYFWILTRESQQGTAHRSRRANDIEEWLPPTVCIPVSGRHALDAAALDGGKLFAASVLTTSGKLYGNLYDGQQWGQQCVLLADDVTTVAGDDRRLSLDYDPVQKQLHLVYVDAESKLRYRSLDSPYRPEDWRPPLSGPGLELAAGVFTSALSVDTSQTPYGLVITYGVEKYRGKDPRQRTGELYARRFDGKKWQGEPVLVSQPGTIHNWYPSVNRDVSDGLCVLYSRSVNKARLGAPLAVMVSVCTATGARGARPETAEPAMLHDVLADYDAELRGADGRVDIDAMVARLKGLGVNTYFWLIWHAATDWEDLKLFLPKAAEAKINVWVYLVPPSESPPHARWYSEPFRLDYVRWAEEIAKLSRQHPNLTAWVIDDFYANRRFYKPQLIRQMQQRAKAINPRLAFLPLMYFREIRRAFTDEYREVIDGVVVAYPPDADEIERAWKVLNDVLVATPGELSYPWGTPSRPGDFAMASQKATVLPGRRCVVTFEERDDFTGPTAGYHFKQVLVDDAVVWEEDVAGGEVKWRPVELDVAEHVKGKREVTLAFRLFNRKGVSNFGVTWSLRRLKAQGLRLASDLGAPETWQVTRRGAFEAGFGEGVKPKGGGRSFHIPFIVMTAGCASQFRKRHPGPATPARIAEWLRMCLECWKGGRCDGVVTYCLDKTEESATFPLARKLFLEHARE